MVKKAAAGCRDHLRLAFPRRGPGRVLSLLWEKRPRTEPSPHVVDRHLPAPSHHGRTQRKAVSWQGPYSHCVESQDKPSSVTCQAGCVSPGWGRNGRRVRCYHLGPEQAAISSLTKVLSLHPLESGLIPLVSMPPLPRRLPHQKLRAPTVTPPTSPRNYHRPWVYLWMFYFSTWRQVL